MTSIQDILSTRATTAMQNMPGARPQYQGLEIGNRKSEIVDQLTYNMGQGTKSVSELAQLTSIIYSMKSQLDALLVVLCGRQPSDQIGTSNACASADKSIIINLKSKIEAIEGVFNGERMVGADGKEYHVPPNYASKSKLVEGDIMKLTIAPQGKFIYKQICPTERKRIVGELKQDAVSGNWHVLSEHRPYRVLLASVTFYRAQAGDHVVILVPKDGEGSWGAMENIIRN